MRLAWLAVIKLFSMSRSPRLRLIGVGRLLLLFAAKIKLGLSDQPVVDGKTSHLRIEVAGKPQGIAV